MATSVENDGGAICKKCRIEGSDWNNLEEAFNQQLGGIDREIKEKTLV